MADVFLPPPASSGNKKGSVFPPKIEFNYNCEKNLFCLQLSVIAGAKFFTGHVFTSISHWFLGPLFWPSKKVVPKWVNQGSYKISLLYSGPHRGVFRVCKNPRISDLYRWKKCTHCYRWGLRWFSSTTRLQWFSWSTFWTCNIVQFPLQNDRFY